MTLTASHRDLDLDVLEQLSSGAGSVASTVVADSPEITGCIVLATCNRFEVYADVADDGDLARVTSTVTEVVARSSGVPLADVVASLAPRTGPDVARHLFAVAAGLDSMVVGEREVAGQVRRALTAARADRTTSAALERLFQTASRASRAVGARTGLSGTGRSVVGVALDLAGRALAEHGLEMAHGRVLLVGTGSYAGASLAALRARGVQDVAVYSPSGRAAVFAAARGLTPVPRDGLTDALAAVDLVVCCSGALGPVIDAATVAEARGRGAREPVDAGRPRPTVLVDLALRHDVAPAVAEVPGVTLVDLASVQRNAPAGVAPALDAATAIVAEQAAEFEAGLTELAAVPAVVALRDHVERVLEAEVERVRATARSRGAGPDGSVDDPGAALTERSLRRFAAAVLHTPAVRARRYARDGHAEEYREALKALFDLDPPRP